MEEKEVTNKMLRAVLQSHKDGVSLAQLQSEYRSLTGEIIPYRKFGFATLELYVRSIPSVVKLDIRSGETVCFAAICKETAHLAQLVARQKCSKKRSGGSRLVNCQIRRKEPRFTMSPVKLKSSLRQPAAAGRGVKPPAQSASRPARALDVLMPKAPAGRDGFESWQTLPLKIQKASLRSPAQANGFVKPKMPNKDYNVSLVQTRLKDILAKFSHGIWISSLPQFYRKLYGEEWPKEAFKDLEHWSHICMIEKSGISELLYPVQTHMQVQSSAAPGRMSSLLTRSASPAHIQLPEVPVEIRVKLAELLDRYSSGLWAAALPKLFQDAYKMKFPEYMLDNLDVLSDICTVDYPIPDNKKKAILYARIADENQNKVSLRRTQNCEDVGRGSVPQLELPKEEYPSVLVVEGSNTNEVVLRYIGKGYSQAQEAMEDEMKVFYHVKEHSAVRSPYGGQLVAAQTEDDEILRAQVCEVKGGKVKVFYVDHGFFEIVPRSRLLELEEHFCALPFQAAKCRLAGLESFSKEPAVLERFDAIACGKILLAEILERSKTPLVVLYDTSQDDDININAMCLKAVVDKSLELPLKVDCLYSGVFVTHVSSSGTLYCRFPSKGQQRLTETLEKIESYFHSKVMSDFLVSLPFCGKLCLVQSKGMWSRVEVANLHGSRVVDIVFVDTGMPASVEVIELREIPSLYLRDLISIPPQAVKCCLAELCAVGSWTPDAVLWLRQAVLNCADCSVKVARRDELLGLLHIHLFISVNFYKTGQSINMRMAQSELWQHQKDVLLSSCPRRPLSGEGSGPQAQGHSKLSSDLQMPLLQLPPSGQNMDVFISLACHPGHFVLQLWQELYKLDVLLGEMILYYNKLEEHRAPIVQNQIYAAKVDNKWQRVLVKGVLKTGLVSVYELDYGRYELVSCTRVHPLIEEFRQLPFQAVRAQLAGVNNTQWSEEAGIFFRQHVEKRALVAQIKAVHDGPQSWDRRLQVYLVDTSEDADIWIHKIMSTFTEARSLAGDVAL
ncbi:tudor domain-containing protein 7A isoform X2 [Erpetoichthys calabaricus]|uniref:tudor domain-containing protein 7A isoform X2 n=1 Tax=Erpetoichthys calabaricus TaxID=27687 RepID=UPI002234DEEB|nr:tudor domain-containing protein 7A isoform X2 [Erpetoichthys calabaricus]